MPYAPKPNDTLEINGILFTHVAHPVAKRFAYACAGAKATVFRLNSSSGAPHGLKVFLPGYRSPRTALNSENLLPYAEISGMDVCARTVLIPSDHYQKLAKTPTLTPPWIKALLEKMPKAIPSHHHQPLLDIHPDLEYAVLMSWIEGKDWKEFLSGKIAITRDQAFSLAYVTASTLAGLERRNIAHGDISSGNVKVKLKKDSSEVYLIDIDDMYAADLPTPEASLFGTVGYNHQSFKSGRWDSMMDRFAGAVIIAEMMGWSEEQVRQQAHESSYFPGEQMQKDCSELQILIKTIRQTYGNPFAEAFKSAWFSSSLENCPTLSDWENLFRSPPDPFEKFDQALKELSLQAESLLADGRTDEALAILRHIVYSPLNLNGFQYLKEVVDRGIRREKGGNFSGALEDYFAALQIAQQEGLREDLQAMIARLKNENESIPKAVSPFRVVMSGQEQINHA